VGDEGREPPAGVVGRNALAGEGDRIWSVEGGR